MTRVPAVVVPPGPGAEALARLGVPVREVAALDAAAALHSLADVLDGSGPLALVPGDLVLPASALAEVLDDPRRTTALAVAATGEGPPVRTRSGLVQSAGSPLHDVTAPDAVSTGLLLVGAADRTAAADAARAAADLPATDGTDPLPLLAVALVRAGVPVRAVDLGEWPWGRAGDPELARRLADLDEERVRVARALRPHDGFYSTFVLRRLSTRLTPLAARAGLTPNAVTLASSGIGLAGAACLARGTRPALITGALLLQTSLVVDCVDGELARLTRRFTPLGAWLDGSSDRVKEYAAYAGLARGAARSGDDLWLLAGAMLTLQTFRHLLDYDFQLAQTAREARPAPLPLDRRDDGRGGTDASGWSSARAIAFSERSNRTDAVRWAKRAVHLPIGERWLVLSAGAALGGPRAALTTLAGLAAVALGYTTAGRTLRSRTWPAADWPPDVAAALRRQEDAGPLARAVARPDGSRAPLAAGLALLAAGAVAAGPAPARRTALAAGVTGGTALLARALPAAPPRRAAWAVPALLRLAELGTVLRATHAVAPEAAPAAYGLLFASAYGHYDALYRVVTGSAPPDELRDLALGFDGRLLAVAGLALAGPRALRRGLPVLAGWSGAVLVVGASGLLARRLLRSGRG